MGTFLPPPVPFHRFERPFGMTPRAFAAYARACDQARISPNRICQTVGNYPRSKGYHLQDGVLNGEPYCAAVDLAVNDLSPVQRDQFLESLARCGFAAWYRSGPKWRFDEHVHAIYAGVPMKWQLREQVRQWNSERRQSGHKPLRWEGNWRRFWA